MRVLISRVAVAVATLALFAVPALAEVHGEFERTLQVSGHVDLQVETGSGSIEVHRGGSNQIHVVGRISANEWFGGGNAEARVKKIESNPPIQQSGNDVRIGHIDDPELKHNISISYEVTVPENTQLRSSSGSGTQSIADIAGPLEGNAGSGNLKFSNIGAAVRAHTGSGSIEADGVHGNLFARTGSGSIHATNVAGGFDGQTGSGHLTLEQSAPVHAETGSGGLELRNVKGSLQASAGSGDVRVEGEATGGWMVRTGSGSVQLKLPSNASFDLDAHTGSGSINLAHPVTVQGSIGRKQVKGKVGGGGVPVEVQTGSGSIRIE
jgi:hypothetical protein